MLRVCHDGEATRQLLCVAAADFAQGNVPATIPECLMLATMTALNKDDGGVRGIATGFSPLRLVAKTVARKLGGKWSQQALRSNLPLSTRAGTECVVRALRVLTDKGLYGQRAVR